MNHAKFVVSYQVEESISIQRVKIVQNAKTDAVSMKRPIFLSMRGFSRLTKSISISYCIKAAARKYRISTMVTPYLTRIVIMHCLQAV